MVKLETLKQMFNDLSMGEQISFQAWVEKHINRQLIRRKYDGEFGTHIKE